MQRLVTFLLACIILIGAGCAAPRPPLVVTPGVQIETLRTNLSLSVRGGKQSLSGRGYLVFKRPDRLHMALLSPFGSTILEIYGEGDRITCLVPGRQIAYRGYASELSEGSLIGGWGLIRWILARPPVVGPSLGTSELVLEDGRKERVFFYANGLVQRKITEDGDEVVYKEYRNADGVPVPERIELTDRRGEQFQLTLEDPEANRPIEEEALVPHLEDYTIVPLALFRGTP